MKLKINHSILKTYTDNKLGSTTTYDEIVTHLFRDFIGLTSSRITKDGINFLIDVGVLEYNDEKLEYNDEK